MNLYTTLSLLFTLAVMIAYINHRLIKIQTSIAVMAAALLLSLALVLLNYWGITDIGDRLALLIKGLHFHNLLVNGMLSFLLFAGGLSVKLEHLKQRKWEIAVLASLSTIVSTLAIAYACYYLLPVIGFAVPFIYCLLFGALISPTDPIAVLAMCKAINAPKDLEVMIAGESLFNDGVGIVIFVTVLHIAMRGEQVSFTDTLVLFSQQAIGGLVYGGVIGWLGIRLIKPINDAKLEILLTLMLTTGGYALAQLLGLSGPLAMVVAGIMIGNIGRRDSLSAMASKQLDTFWELIDEILNALLFLLIGFEVLLLHFNQGLLFSALLIIPLVLLIRAISISAPMGLFKLKRQYKPHTVNILIWGGLRGGLAVALALSVPQSPYRDLILVMTYAVVAFSIIVQGLTISPLVKRSNG